MTVKAKNGPGDVVRFSDGALGIVYKKTAGGLSVFPLAKGRELDGKEALGEGSLPGKYRVLDLAVRKGPARTVGRVKPEVMDRLLRKMISEAVEAHHEAVHRKSAPFQPGRTAIHYGGRVYDSEEIKLLVESGLDFWLTSGRFAARFERELARFLGVRHVMLTNSGSSANLLAISALTAPELGERRLAPGDEVITLACGFPTTVNPIIQNRLRPVFLDVDVGTYNVQAERIEKAISPRTKAVFLAHTLGNPFDLDTVTGVCREHDLWLVEDNCDALGAKYRGRHTGTFGDISTFSFYPAHHITMGEGGALATGDPKLRKLILSFRDWGRDCWCETGQDDTCRRRFGWKLGDLPFGYDHKYTYSHIGYNLKATDMQAAVGVAQLAKLPLFVRRRRENWKRLYNGLKKHGRLFVLPRPTPGSEPSWFGFVLTVREGAGFTRNELTAHLEKNRIATRLLFCGNLLRHPAYAGIECSVPDGLSNTDVVMNDTFWVGVYPGLTAPMVDHMLRTFDGFIESGKR